MHTHTFFIHPKTLFFLANSMTAVHELLWRGKKEKEREKRGKRDESPVRKICTRRATENTYCRSPRHSGKEFWKTHGILQAVCSIGFPFPKYMSHEMEEKYLKHIVDSSTVSLRLLFSLLQGIRAEPGRLPIFRSECIRYDWNPLSSGLPGWNLLTFSAFGRRGAEKNWIFDLRLVDI